MSRMMKSALGFALMALSLENSHFSVPKTTTVSRSNRQPKELPLWESDFGIVVKAITKKAAVKKVHKELILIGKIDETFLLNQINVKRL